MLPFLFLISVILSCIGFNKLTYKIKYLIRINVDEIIVWLESIVPIYLIAYVFYKCLFFGNPKMYDESFFLSIISIYISFWIFVFKWFAMIFKNKEETNLQIKYSTIWGVGIILSQIAKHSQIAYHIWKIIFLPVIAISSSTDFMPSDGFVALSLVMCGLSLFLIWGYRKSS